MSGTTLLFGALLSAACCLAYMEIGGISFKDAIVLPPHARKEVVHARHRDVINQVEKLVRASRSLAGAEERIKDASWPQKVLHIGLAQAARAGGSSGRSQDPRPSAESGYSREAWTNLRTVHRDGSGYGTAVTAEGQREIIVAYKTVKCVGGVDIVCTVYLEAPPSS